MMRRLPLLRTRALCQTRFMSGTGSNPDLAFMVTTRRWLYNNETQMSLRRLNFDIDALGAAAAKASGASECSEIQVIGEGTFNRVFRLVLSNGKDVIARIPFPNAGPRNLLTRSEVATMEFVRSRLRAPIPKVLAWDATSNNDVGCEYIIMEKCEGSPLEKRLDPGAESFPYVFDIAKLMSNLISIPFSQYGGLYFKEDVDSHLQERPLYAEGEEHDAFSERFRIGPSVECRFYRGGRAHMSIDRGPWKDVHSYIKAAVLCETEWIHLHSESLQARNQLGARHRAEQHISLLNKWLSLSPAVLPEPGYCAPTLSHPDLHAGNIFIADDDSMSVAWVIDWQGAAVRPRFETELPKFLDVEDLKLKYVECSGELLKPVLPDNFDGLKTEEKAEALKEFRQVWPRHAFFTAVRQLRPPFLVILRLLHLDLLRRAIYYSSHSWCDGLPLLEQCLMSLSAAYGDSIPVHKDHPTCPVVFSEDDVKRHEEEFEEIIFFEEWLSVQMGRLMEKEGLHIHQDGSINPENLEAAVKKAAELLTFFTTREGMTKEKQMKTRRHWPMREGKFVFSMESCI